MSEKEDYIFNTTVESNTDLVIRQFANDVRSFSSQYGSDISISYTAYNICGQPSKYPAYGDFPQTFVMRTYGKWWDMAPSRRIEFMPQNYPTIRSQDYIDITFDMKVMPTRLEIFETYHPGSVVRVWAAVENGKWKLLWEGKPQVADHQPNIFSPVLNKIDSYVNLLRIEFDHSNLDYYTEIDAVLLTGSRPPKDDAADIVPKMNDVVDATLTNLCLKTIDTNISNIFLNFLENDYPNFVRSLESSTDTTSKPTRRNNGILGVLPDETMFKILSYLDLKSLSRCAQVNRYFNMLASDSLLYTALNFKPYWHSVNSNTLDNFTSRCKHLQKLDLSWCGNYGIITSTALCSFIKNCGQNLTHLRLDGCSFVNDQCLLVIASVCQDLEELTLHNCNDIHETGYLQLCALTKLKRLELYRTSIESGSLSNILKSSPNLKHLNLGSCCRIYSMDEIAQILGKYNKELVSVDFWKTYSLTPIGIKALSQCSKLEEIDIGWCLGVSIPGDCFISLALGCRGLRKLFMGSLRGIMDKDLYPFLYNCPKLEQLDLLGNRNVTTDLCYNILESCKNLKFLDVSFCEQIHDRDVECYRKLFPTVDIKRSFQCDLDCPCSFPNHY